MKKRIFDIFFSIFAIAFLSWLLIISWLMAAIDTASLGVFIQTRIGQYGKTFKIIKLKTIHDDATKSISKIGNFLRKSKIDELPQLFNILFGQMSFVGYRPDIPGYYDLLSGNDRKILLQKPGLTSWASIKYANEEEVLSKVKNPLEYNNQIIFPDKVKMNLQYFETHTLRIDLQIIFKTVFGKWKN